MAEKSGNLLVTPEVFESDGGTSGRTSTGEASSDESGEKVLPHYLRVSTGSCHDLCKYGRRHVLEAEARHPMGKRIAKPSIDKQSPMTSTLLPERKKTSVERPKLAPILKTFPSDIPEIIKHKVSTRSPNGGNVLNMSVESHNPVKGKVLLGIQKTSASKLSHSPTSETRLSESPKFSRQELSAVAKMELSSKTVKSKSKEKNSLLKHASSLKPKSLVQKPFSSPDISGGLTGGRNSDIMTGLHKVAVKKVVASPRLSLSSQRALVSPKPSIGKVANKVMASPIVLQASSRASSCAKPSISRVSKQVFFSPRVSLASSSPRSSLSRVASPNARKHKTLKVVSSMNNQGQTKTDECEGPNIKLKHTNNDLVQEKTLYIIKMETQNKSLESYQNESYVVEPALPPSCLLAESHPVSPSSLLLNDKEQEISEYPESGIEDASLSLPDETISTEEDVGDEGRPRRAGMVHSEDKGSQAIKLHFRRGKVIDLQSQNDNPRRLKFRRGRVLGENETLKGDGRRSFNNGGIDDVVIDSNPGSQKVVLRHQNVQEKKDSPILLNKVIEQTASKLAQSRKSKVKALVGAFETVISLRGTKPYANTVA